MLFSRRRAILFSLLLVFLAPLNASERDNGPDPDRRSGIRRINQAPPSEDCLQFNCESIPSEISPDNVTQLDEAWRVLLPDIADGSPIYVSNVIADFAQRDLLILGTMSGSVVAVDAQRGDIVWTAEHHAGPRWTTASPAIDPNREYVYAYALDGYVHRYSIHDGSEVGGDGWPELITLKGDVEKCSSSLSVVTTKDGKNYLYATIAAYPDPGDDGDYQGHLVAIDLSNGEQHVFNALCSDKPFHFDASGSDATDCRSQQAGIWARAGAVYDSVTDRTYITTGNGPFDADQGGFNWGTCVLALHPDGTTDNSTPLDSYTPVEYQSLTENDWDLSSTTVATLPIDSDLGRFAVQGGKDGKLRLLNLSDLSGQGGPRHIGGELQIINLDAGTHNRPATWLAPDGTPWVFVTTYQSTIAFSATIDDESGMPRLEQQWQRVGGGSSPIVDSGILFRARSGLIEALDPETGDVLWSNNTIGNIHWQSPIVVNDTLYLSNHQNALIAFRLRN